MKLKPTKLQRRLWMGIPLAVILVSMPGPSRSVRAQRQQIPAHAERRAPRPPAELPPVAGGLRVAIDPVTLEKVAEGSPAAASSVAHLEALSQSMEGLSVIHRPDGSKYLDLQGRFRCGVVARIDTEGTKRICVGSVAQAEAALHSPANPRAALEVE